MADLATILDQDGGRHLVREYLDRTLLDRRDWSTPLAQSAYGMQKGVPSNDGQYVTFSRRNRFRRPQHMASPGGAGADPLSGASMGYYKVQVPVEFIQEYVQIAAVANMTSWDDLESWANHDMPEALKRRANELTQNAMGVGRMTPGVYAADGTTSTSFDASAQATPTLYNVAFAFNSCPKFYAGMSADFDSLGAADRAKWADFRQMHVRLSNAGAPKIGGKYIAVISDAMWNDLLQDEDGGRLDAAIKGGFKTAIKGLEDQTFFDYAGFLFVQEDNPMTEDLLAEGVRANYGAVHSCQVFGAGCWGYVQLGRKTTMKPKMKVQDITTTGVHFTIGYLVPYQVAVIEPGWGITYKAPVSEALPNNYDPADPDNYLDGFGV